MKILLQGGSVADGENMTVRRADVLVADGKIAAVGEGLSSDGAEVLDCTGLIVTPGYTDAHVHVESGMVLPEAFGDAVLPFGTTAIIADPHEVVNVAGGEGLKVFLKECDRARIDIFVCLPSGVPATPLDTNGAGKFTAADMTPFLSHPRVVGLGEVMCFRDAAEGEPEMAAKIALFKGKTVDGHTSGMPESMLDAYVAAGVCNDHECASKESMFARYDRGMNIYIREGSAARNASDLLDGVKERGLDIGRFAFCTDDKHLATIAREGHISYIAALAREKGFGWGEIARMASYDPALYYGLSDRGNIREGMRADIVVTSDDARHVRYVLKDGDLVAKDHKLILKHTKGEDKPAVFENTVHLRNFSAEDFAVPERLKNIAIGLVDGQLLTELVRVDEGARFPQRRVRGRQRGGYGSRPSQTQRDRRRICHRGGRKDRRGTPHARVRAHGDGRGGRGVPPHRGDGARRARDGRQSRCGRLHHALIRRAARHPAHETAGHRALRYRGRRLPVTPRR